MHDHVHHNNNLTAIDPSIDFGANKMATILMSTFCLQLATLKRVN